MTYLNFHLVFTLPPILGLIFLLIAWKGGNWLLKRVKPIGLLALIAVVYTTPWDNYLVYKEVWSYGSERVLGTIGFVPIEEYAFFILQTLLSGLLLLVVGEWKQPVDQPALRPRHRLAIAVFLGLVLLTGIVFLGSDSMFYLGLIIVWALPIVLFQWLLGAEPIVESKRSWVPVVLLSTVYLGAADLFAISEETWSISSRYTTHFHLFGLPVEEALFFLLTNVMVVWGILLFEHYANRWSSDPPIQFESRGPR